MVIFLLKMKHFLAGIGEINFVSYLLYICVGLAPLFHIYVIGSELSFVKIVLSILGIIFVCILTIARFYRNFFYKE
jgi:genome